MGYNFDPSTFDSLGQGDPSAIYRLRQISENFELALGHTAVLGIGPVPHTQVASSRIPVLGDAPVVGKLFRKEIKTTVQKNLWFFITPTLVETNAANTRPPQ
jgi:type II secretory pathway component GspD/PulD (secretin)